MIRSYCSFLMILSLLAAGSASAQMEARLTPSMDNTIYEESGSLSNGSGDHLFVGNTNSGNARRALVAFDVDESVPEGAQVDSVRLTLELTRTISGQVPINVHRLTTSWGEAGSDAPGEEGGGASAASGDATWTHAFFDTETWQNVGGDFVAAPSASFMAGATGTYTIPSTAALTADVQQWLDDPDANFGWILIGGESANSTAKRFESRENATSANRPQLTVFYSTTTAAERPETPGSFVLEGNFPNPFSRSTVVRYELERAQEVGLEVFDITGRPVKTVPARLQTAGPHEVEIGAGDLASGLYIYCVTGGSARVCRTLTVLR